MYSITESLTLFIHSLAQVTHCLLPYSFIHSSRYLYNETHLTICSLTHCLAHQLLYIIIHSFIHSLLYKMMCTLLVTPLSHLLLYLLINRSSSAHLPINSLTITDSYVNSIICSLVLSVTQSLFHVFTI